MLKTNIKEANKVKFINFILVQKKNELKWIEVYYVLQ